MKTKQSDQLLRKMESKDIRVPFPIIDPPE